MITTRVLVCLGCLTAAACGSSTTDFGDTESGAGGGTTSSNGGSTANGTGGSAQGGSAQGGSAQGGSAQGGSAQGGSGGAGGQGGAPTCDASAFTDAADTFALPTGLGYAEFNLPSDASCGTTDTLYFVTDMNGDDLPDLVVTSNCDGSSIGATEWVVHEGNGTDFAAGASSWFLPAGYTEFNLPADSSCGTTDTLYFVTDMNGDDLPDLVVTSNCDGGAVGTSHWLVHENIGNRFASTPSTWTLPSGYTEFNLPADSSCGTTDTLYTVTDMDGDDLPDLVVTSTCDGGTIGTDEWALHASDGSGFAANAASWALPGGYTEFNLPADSSCGTTDTLYFLADMDGDDLTDLVVTSTCDGGTIGTDEWALHASNGTSFASNAASWALPDGYTEFNLPADSSCGTTDTLYTVTDMDGDDLPDLAVTSTCDGGTIGTDAWAVHQGDGSAFSAAPLTWTLPTGYTEFNLPADASCGTTDTLYFLADMDGSGSADLVVTSQCDGGAVGTQQWNVHLALCAN